MKALGSKIHVLQAELQVPSFLEILKHKPHMLSITRLTSLLSIALAAAAVAIPNEPRQNDLPAPFGGTHTGSGELSPFCQSLDDSS